MREVRRRGACDYADGHHAAVRVEPGEEGGHVRAGDDVDDDVVARGSVLAPLAGAVQRVGRAELAQAIAALGRRRGDRHRTGTATSRELNRHDADAPGRAAYQHRLAGSEVGMAEAEVGHRPGAPERHRIGGLYTRREGEERHGGGDRLLRVAAAQAGERPYALTDP